jgi:DNA-binding TFAR19-related protein (PDSD5 family)
MSEDDEVEVDHINLWPFIPVYRDIPELFHSLELGGPFRHCLGCDADLTDPAICYCIDRVFRGTEPVVEYAMCSTCQESLRAEFSAESLKLLDDILSEPALSQRLTRLREYLPEPDIDQWVNECLVTGKPRGACKGFQVIAVCRGMQLEITAIPAMISDEAVDHLLSRLSKQTRDRFDQFFGDMFGLPPELCASSRAILL